MDIIVACLIGLFLGQIRRDYRIMKIYDKIYEDEVKIASLLDEAESQKKLNAKLFSLITGREKYNKSKNKKEK